MSQRRRRAPGVLGSVSRPLVAVTVGVVITLVLAVVVIWALLRAGGVGLLSDNAALIGALVALGGVATAQMVGTSLANERSREEALQKYIDRMGELLKERREQLRKQPEQLKQFDDEIRELETVNRQLEAELRTRKDELNRLEEDLPEKLEKYRRWQKRIYKAGEAEVQPSHAKDLETEAIRKVEDARRGVEIFEGEIEPYKESVEVLKRGKSTLSQGLIDELRLMRAQTLAVLDQVGKRRKREVMRFLSETELLKRYEESRMVDLRGADFSGVDLTGLDLSHSNLREVILRGADLSGVDLAGADLTGADVTGEQLGPV